MVLLYGEYIVHEVLRMVYLLLLQGGGGSLVSK